MNDIIKAIDLKITPDKSICKKYNIKLSRSWFDGILGINLLYRGTLVSSTGSLFGEGSDHKATHTYCRSLRDVNFGRIIIGDKIRICFSMQHPYGNILNKLHDKALNMHKADSVTAFGDVNSVFVFDLNCPESIDQASQKILYVFRLVKQINRITRKTGEFDVQKIKIQCNL